MRLTEKERAALVFISDYHLTWKRAPSFHEVGYRVGWSSTATVSYHLKRMKAGGYVDWEPGIPRSLHVVDRRAA